MQSLSVSAHTAGVPAPAALALCRRCQRSLRQACQGRSWERAQRRNAAAHALAPWAGDVSGPMEGSAHASGALVPRWRGVWRRGGNRTLHRGNGHFNSCSVPSYFFGLTVCSFLCAGATQGTGTHRVLNGRPTLPFVFCVYFCTSSTRYKNFHGPGEREFIPKAYEICPVVGWGFVR